MVTQVPVLQGTQVGEAVAARFIHQGVLEDPAEAGGIGPEFGLDPLWQTRQDTGEIFEGA
jgi:hypothetical protein